VTNVFAFTKQERLSCFENEQDLGASAGERLRLE
jgi:hypothetical protein